METIIIVSIAIAVIALAGMVTDSGENTWEGLIKIYRKSINRAQEIELEMMKEETRQMAEEYKLRELEFKNNKS